MAPEEEPPSDFSQIIAEEEAKAKEAELQRQKDAELAAKLQRDLSEEEMIQ
jgi:hypothetical protein